MRLIKDPLGLNLIKEVSQDLDKVGSSPISKLGSFGNYGGRNLMQVRA